MPFTNKSISEEDAAGSSSGGYVVWPNGNYQFDVKSAEEGSSKAGNDMVTVICNVYSGASVREMRTYLVLIESTQWKVREFYESLGMLKEYDSGIIDATKLIGKSGSCYVDSEEKTDNGETKTFNQINGFNRPGSGSSAPKKAVTTKEAPSSVEDEDDDIPF